MSRLVVVLPLRPLAVGDSFPVRSWPPHVTVVRPFDRLGDRLPELPALEPFEIVLGERAAFGRGGSVPVLLVEPSPTLAAARDRCLDFLALSDAGEWRPHVTLKGDTSLAPGDHIRLGQVALVTMGPGDREVLAAV